MITDLLHNHINDVKGMVNDISPQSIIKEEIFIVLKWNGMPPYCDIFTCTCYQNKQ